MFGNNGEQILRETIFADLLDLADIIEHTDDLNEHRSRMKEMVTRLEYLLIDEG